MFSRYLLVVVKISSDNARKGYKNCGVIGLTTYLRIIGEIFEKILERIIGKF